MLPELRHQFPDMEDRADMAEGVDTEHMHLRNPHPDSAGMADKGLLAEEGAVEAFHLRGPSYEGGAGKPIESSRRHEPRDASIYSETVAGTIGN